MAKHGKQFLLKFPFKISKLLSNHRGLNQPPKQPLGDSMLKQGTICRSLYSYATMKQ